MNSPWIFPDKAKFGRVVPKNKIYEHSAASAGLKSLFVQQVDQILWAYKLSPNTLNIPHTSEISEIQVISVKLKGDEVDNSVLKAIDLAIPFPILFEVWGLVVNKATMPLAISVRQKMISPNGFVATIYTQKYSIPVKH